MNEEEVLKKFQEKKWKVRKDDRGFIYLKKYNREITIDTFGCNYFHSYEGYISYAEHRLIGKILSLHDCFGRKSELQ